MTKKIACLLVLTMLLSCSLILTTVAKVDPRLDDNTANRIDQFNLNKLSREDIRNDTGARAASALGLPLGATGADAGIGVGEVVDNTWADFQSYMHGQHFVASGIDATDDGITDVGLEVHFVYDELPSIDTATAPNYYKSGYNFYNASYSAGSNWPEGQEAGCQLEAQHQYGGGRGVNLAMLPDGRVAFASRTTMRSEHNGEFDSTTFLDNQEFYQQDKSSFNRCYWDSLTNVSMVLPATYTVGWITEGDDEPALAATPTIETQIIGSDTVTHLLLIEAATTVSVPGYPVLDDGYGWSTISYFRKVGTATPGTWSAATVIDTNFWYGAGMAASPVSSDVAIAMPKISPLGRLNANYDDCDMYFTTSSDGGLTWTLPMTNLTHYSRTEDSYTSGQEVALLYDSRGYLHIVWAAQPCPADPYRGGYHWPDFNRDFFHWSDAISGSYSGGTISMIQSASFDVNPIACSYGGYNAAQLAWFNITECDGNLYAVYNMYHFRVLELGIVPEAYNDCPSTIESTVHSANAEIILNVSSSLDGLLWDAPRNLTNTYTPGCDSVGGEGGPCGNEYKPGAERWATDPTGLGTLTWPTAAKIDPADLAGQTPYGGDWYFNALYCDDQYPGEWQVDASAYPFFNSMKWLRIACVDPIEAPQIAATPTSIAWPRWQRYNEDSAYTVTVTNDGNVPLQVTSIATNGGGWLSTSVGSMTVAAGASPDNQGTFDVNVNTAGFSAPQFLDGEVYLISNVEPEPPATVDTLTVSVHLLVADTVEPLIWDTVATSSAWDAKSATGSGDNIALAMGNHGEFGQNGQLGVNLDFGVDGNDPGNRGRDSMYLYTGSMYLLKNNGGGDVAITTSIQQRDQATSAASQDGFPTNYSFDPVPDGGTMSSGIYNDGTEDVYDSVFGGRMANRDTSIYVERTFYAPRNMSATNPSFIVVKSKVFTGTKGAQSNLSIGDVCDWDVPADAPPNNTSATSIPANVTYMQGTVDPDSSFAWDNSQRFATEAMMGWATGAELGSDPCSETRTYHGSFATFQGMMNDTVVAPFTDSQPNAQMWWDSIATYDYNSGNTADTDQTMWMTYMHDFSLTDSDTLYFWTALATVKQGGVSDLEALVSAAYNWYFSDLRGCSSGCCIPPTVGDCDQSGGVDITDISVLIDNQFLTLTPLICEAEGDCDFSGGVDITDLSVLIDNQFLTLTPLKDCQGNPTK